MVREYTVIGIMSGTSLDGVDMAACNFKKREGAWSYRIRHAVTELYSEDWKAKLAGAHRISDQDLDRLDREYGRYLGTLIQEFCRKHDIHPDLVASHGHTVFHEPEKGITRQIGSGSEIAGITDLPVVFDFRSDDVAKGGQGAPLVPVGDKLLFYEYDACLNLGGFSNISFDLMGKRRAFDICPVNIVLNQIAAGKQKDFDRDGELGRTGRIDQKLLAGLNNLNYYRQPPPKSLSREWLETEFIPLMERSGLSPEDLAATVYQHIMIQLLEVFSKYGIKQVLLTGGGALNTYLTNLLKNKSQTGIIIPGRILIDFKEALVFAFLGLLRYRNEINCFASVTGASEDSVAGKLIKKAPE